jgi:hypothetical protein
VSSNGNFYALWAEWAEERAVAIARRNFSEGAVTALLQFAKEIIAIPAVYKGGLGLGDLMDPLKRLRNAMRAVRQKWGEN